jgi:hypothetical protein
MVWNAGMILLAGASGHWMPEAALLRCVISAIQDRDLNCLYNGLKVWSIVWVNQESFFTNSMPARSTDNQTQPCRSESGFGAAR